MTTTPTTDNLLALDVNALDGIELAKAIAVVRGWTHITEQTLYKAVPDHAFGTVSSVWTGTPPGEAWPRIAGLPRPDRDTDAAVSLLNEGVERWGGVQIAADMEEWEAGGLYDVGFYDTVYSGLAPFCVAVCRAYLLAWQASHNEVVGRAERKAERERELSHG